MRIPRLLISGIVILIAGYAITLGIAACVSWFSDPAEMEIEVGIGYDETHRTRWLLERYSGSGLTRYVASSLLPPNDQFSFLVIESRDKSQRRRVDPVPRQDLFPPRGDAQAEWMALAAEGKHVLVIVDQVGWPFRGFWAQIEGPEYQSPVKWAIALPDRDPLGLHTSNVRAICLRPLWPGLVLNVIICGSLCFIVHRAIRSVRAVWRRWNVRCPICGYNLRGLQAAGCPECGWGREKETVKATGADASA
jgi:hypothetical protein